MDSRLSEVVASELESDLVEAAPVRGGDFATSFKVTLADGRAVFLKTHSNPPRGFFSTEAAGLRWLGEARSELVPVVLAVSDEPPHLILEWIDTGRPSRSTDGDFGRALAELHRSGSVAFGREDRRTTGSQTLPNDPTNSWASFYGERRLLPLAEIAERNHSLPSSAIEQLRCLPDRLVKLVGPPEPPARLHGDLWAGNRMVDSSGRNWLIDPACFGGHREFDLAMMRLFGGFGADTFSAYDEVFPLAPGWEDRIELNQIAPLVVHAIKFGGSYVDAAVAAITRYV